MNFEKVVENDIKSTKDNSFRKTRKRYFKKSLNGNNTKSISIDDFGSPYRYQDSDDKTKIYSLTFPTSLIKIVDSKRGDIPRSRFIREMIVFCLDLEQQLPKNN